MSKISLNSYTGYFPSPKRAIKTLSSELVIKLLSFFNDKQRGKARLVSHFWRRISIAQSAKLSYYFYIPPGAHLSDRLFAKVMGFERVTREIREICKSPDYWAYLEALRDKCDYLIEEGFLDEAIEVAKEIPGHAKLLKNAITMKYVENGFIEKALNMSPGLPVLYDIACELYKNGQIDQGIESVSKLAFTPLGQQFLQCLALVCVNHGNLFQARIIVGMMLDEPPKWKVLHQLTIAYHAEENLNGVIETGCRIHEPHYLKSALGPVLYDLLQKQKEGDMEEIIARSSVHAGFNVLYDTYTTMKK